MYSECVKWQEVCLREEKSENLLLDYRYRVANPVFIRGPTAGTDIRQHRGGTFKITVACDFHIMVDQFMGQSMV